MRIAIAGFMHESNTFTGEKTELRHFQEAYYHRGEELVPVWQDAHHELGGFIAGCREANVELVPLLAAWATPKGPVTDAAYEHIAAELLKCLRAAGPIDGLLLALHGAMVTESHSSADSETVRRVRSAIGSTVPLILSLDMHANVTEDMIRLPDATVAYRTYPHVDQRERGRECARLAIGAAQGKIKPVQAGCKLPLLIHIVQQFTGSGPMASVYSAVERTATQSGILSVSCSPGYIYADVPHMGVCVNVVADRDTSIAKAAASALAKEIFALRDELNAGLPDTASAVAQAKALEGTVCLMDSGDNIGGGGPGDSTILFHELCKQGVPRVCVVLYDPEAARTCAEAGEGVRVALRVGAKTDAQHGAPASITGKVLHISDGVFVEEEARHGGMREYNQGLTAVVHTDDGHTVVLNSLRVMPTSLRQLLSLGIDPAKHKAIIVKGVTAPRAAYDPIAAAIIPVDTPGVTQAGPEAFEYKNRPQPLYPLDPIESWKLTCW
ncbi:MAG: hypothetical protein AMXMBFR84_15070 [Candidatus Hydrogenedentota bacterium]